MTKHSSDSRVCAVIFACPYLQEVPSSGCLHGSGSTRPGRVYRGLAVRRLPEPGRQRAATQRGGQVSLLWAAQGDMKINRACAVMLTSYHRWLEQHCPECLHMTTSSALIARQQLSCLGCAGPPWLRQHCYERLNMSGGSGTVPCLKLTSVFVQGLPCSGSTAVSVWTCQEAMSLWPACLNLNYSFV